MLALVPARRTMTPASHRPVPIPRSSTVSTLPYIAQAAEHFTRRQLGLSAVDAIVGVRRSADHADVELRDSVVAFMPRATFAWLLDTSMPFNRFLLTQLNERLGQFIGMVEHDRLLGPDARLARCLASMFNPHLYPGIGPSLRISQEEIAQLAGLSRQRANQALQRLEQAGLLRIEYGGITVTDLEGLRRLDS